MNLRQLPNLISVIRILLVVPVIWGLLAGEYLLALILFVLAGVSDGLDGFLARRYQWTTRLGGYLDPLGDKLLMVSCYLTLGWLGYLPVWLVLAVILRDVIIVCGTLLYRWLIGPLQAEPLLISKINTVLQILLVGLVIMSMAMLADVHELIHAMMYLVFITTVMSGTAYIALWGGRAWRRWPGRKRA